MKYPAGISGEAYAAMEEGYEQGRESMRGEIEEARTRAAAAEAETARVTQVFSEADTALNEKYDAVCEERDALRADGAVTVAEYHAGIAGAVSGALDGFAQYLYVKASHAEGRVPGTYADGMRNAAADAELWLEIGETWTEEWQRMGGLRYITEPTDEWPEGSECPVHRRVHSSHGWYVCVPGGVTDET